MHYIIGFERKGYRNFIEIITQLKSKFISVALPGAADDDDASSSVNIATVIDFSNDGDNATSTMDMDCASELCSYQAYCEDGDN